VQRVNYASQLVVIRAKRASPGGEALFIKNLSDRQISTGLVRDPEPRAFSYFSCSTGDSLLLSIVSILDKIRWSAIAWLQVPYAL
jgi:hypothetical protein